MEYFLGRAFPSREFSLCLLATGHGTWGQEHSHIASLRSNLRIGRPKMEMTCLLGPHVI